MSDNGIYILGAARTPIARMMGGLATIPAPELGAVTAAKRQKSWLNFQRDRIACDPRNICSQDAIGGVSSRVRLKCWNVASVVPLRK